MKNTRLQLSFFVGLSTLLGALIWVASARITGHTEPWDAAGVFYPLALFVTGLIPAYLSPARWWLYACGSCVGQGIGALLVSKSALGPLAATGMGFLLLYSLISLAGAGCGAGLRTLARGSKA